MNVHRSGKNTQSGGFCPYGQGFGPSDAFPGWDDALPHAPKTPLPETGTIETDARAGYRTDPGTGGSLTRKRVFRTIGASLMNILGAAVYRVIRFAFKLRLSLAFDFVSWGEEHIPEGPKLFCSNHFSSSDPFFAMALLREPVHMVIGTAYGFPVVPFFLDRGEQINAYGEHRKTVVAEAVKYLKKGESVYIFPEGDLNDQTELRKFYHGLARIYLTYPVPIVPIGLVAPRRNVREKEKLLGETFNHRLVVTSKNYYANVGKPLRYPELECMEDRARAEAELTADVRARIAELIRDIKEHKFWS
jgi:1-acyl-sn-glycerol-3-phosphate acyltransferase